MAHVVEAFQILFMWDTLLLCFVGATIGLVFGAVPGLSGGMGMILALPLTINMDPVKSVALLCSIFTGGISGGYIGSILLGIPGEASSVATVYDGYEFTRQGNPVRALSAATIANFIGTVPGVIIAIVLCKLISLVAVKLGPWEIFGFGLSAIVMIASLSEGNMWKGLLGAGIGLMVSCVGMAPVSGTPRFSFGIYQLAGGFERANVVLGVYAGRTIFLEYIKGARLNDAGPQIKVSRFKLSIKDITDNIGNILRSFGIGAWIGFLPGLGGSLSNVVAYATQKNFSKHPETFGTGNIEGVIAPEVANNASLGGALIPTITLGIPGSGVMAYLLVGLTMAGITPGPLLMIAHPTVVYMIYIAIIFSAVGILLFEVLGMPLFPLLLKTPYHVLYPIILALCFVGAYVVVGNISSAIVLILFTLVGIWFHYVNIPPTCFVLAFILADILEKNFRMGISKSPEYRGLSFFVRPVSCGLIILCVLLLFWPTVKKAILARNAKLKAVIDQVEEDDD